MLCAGPYFALERWRTRSEVPLSHTFDTAVILSNAGPAAVPVRCGEAGESLEPAGTLLLPAALGSVEMQGPADVFLGYLPNLDHDVRTPLLAAGHATADIAALGEGLG